MIPKIFFGCLKLGLRFNSRLDIDILNYAFDHGVIGYDTSLSYGYGRSIELLGKFSKNKRDKIYISSKIGILPPNYRLMYLLAYNLKKKFRIKNTPARFLTNIKKSFNRETFNINIIEKQLNMSLKKLNTDYLDLLSLHHVNIDDVNDENIYFLKQLVAKGKIKNFGFSPIDDFDNFISYNFTHLSYDYFLKNISKINKDQNYLIYSIYGNKSQLDKQKLIEIQNQFNLSYVISMFNKKHISQNINLLKI